MAVHVLTPLPFPDAEVISQPMHESFDSLSEVLTPEMYASQLNTLLCVQSSGVNE